MAELQNSESRVAKLRDKGERLHLPYAALQEVFKLEVSGEPSPSTVTPPWRISACSPVHTHLFPLQDVLDGMWTLLRHRCSDLSGPLIAESQHEALLQGMAELVRIGKEKLSADHLRPAKSKAALQAQVQHHKVGHRAQSLHRREAGGVSGSRTLRFLPWRDVQHLIM